MSKFLAVLRGLARTTLLFLILFGLVVFACWWSGQLIAHPVKTLMLSFLIGTYLYVAAYT